MECFSTDISISRDGLIVTIVGKNIQNRYYPSHPCLLFWECESKDTYWLWYLNCYSLVEIIQ